MTDFELTAHSGFHLPTLLPAPLQITSIGLCRGYSFGIFVCTLRCNLCYWSGPCLQAPSGLQYYTGLWSLIPCPLFSSKSCSCNLSQPRPTTANSHLKCHETLSNTTTWLCFHQAIPKCPRKHGVRYCTASCPLTDRVGGFIGNCASRFPACTD